ncbi:class I SAM-dependent methyltransferase [Salinimicrobium gaetbulicola]|uniref:Class I SAM-dependent methyltransferase n=1 Tax=Salinimicrobium gaetbulicola TaxID=999702 RepID=A0ABW3IC71_9FLAO
MKDNFSRNSDKYALYRPGYPEELFQYLKGLTTQKQRAWDCGTGNGQVASKLSEFMTEVYATDISEQQLSQAIKKANITYSKQPAESTNFPEKCFDLITIAQAIHWFNFQDFYKEVRRVLKPTGYIAVIGYGLFRCNLETENIIDHLYRDILGEYWDAERQYLEGNYQGIPFPFREIKTPEFQLSEKWSFEHLTGYLNTWSAVKHYEKATGENPVLFVREELQRAFGQEGKVIFPTLFRVGMLR